jgi:phosphocarrier protein FPr
MLTLKPEDIFIGCRANSKKKALRIAADSLQASGYVSEGFLNQWWSAKRRSLPGSGRGRHAPLQQGGY